MIANNASSLVKARRLGLAPAGPVVVSMVGGSYHDLAEAALYVHPDMPVDGLDWRLLVNLEVWLWANASAALGWVLQTAVRIAQAQPRRLVLRFEEGEQLHDVDLGAGYHHHAIRDIPATHAFRWEPLALNATPLERRLCSAALAHHPMGSTL